MRKVLALAGVTIVVANAWIVALPASSSLQPIPFNHAKHVGAACALCHAGVERTAGATLPQVAVCVKCHATAPAGVAQPRWDAMAKTGHIDWVKLTRLPDHVMFSHRRHVVLGQLDCRSCHGTIGASTAPPPRAAARLQMKTCVSCHQQEAASQDCAACHR